MEKYLVSNFYVLDGDAYEISCETFTDLEEALDSYFISLDVFIGAGSIVHIIHENDAKFCVELYNCSKENPVMRFEYAPYLV